MHKIVWKILLEIPHFVHLIIQIYELLGVDPSLPLSLVRTVGVSNPTPYLSATFLLILPDRQPSLELVTNLTVSRPQFEAGQFIP